MRFADLISFLAVESRYLVPGMIIREPQKSIRNRKFYDAESKKAPPKRGKKTIFFRLESKARDISDCAYLPRTNVLPQAQEHLSAHIPNSAAIRLRFFPQLKEYHCWIRTSLGFKYRIGAFWNHDILIIPGEFFPQDFILVEIIAIIFGQPACNIKVVSVVVNVGNDVKIAYMITRKSLKNVL